VGLTTTHAKIGPLRFEFEADVDAAPLSEILLPDEIQNARVIKIDVEGAEWAVASGMASLLRCCRRDLEIVIEVVPEYLAPQGKRPEDVLQIFLDGGFYAYSLPPEDDASFYLSSNSERPRRIRSSIQGETNVVLSRHDAEVL